MKSSAAWLVSVSRNVCRLHSGTVVRTYRLAGQQAPPTVLGSPNILISQLTKEKYAALAEAICFLFRLT
jgi:hypothetical protein